MEHQRPFCPLSSQAAFTGTSDPSQCCPLGLSTLPEVDTGRLNVFQDPIFSLVGDVESDFQVQEGLVSNHQSMIKVQNSNYSLITLY